MSEEPWMIHTGNACPVLPDCGVEVEYKSGHVAVGRAAERDWSQVRRYRIFSIHHPPLPSTSAAAPAFPPEPPFARDVRTDARAPRDTSWSPWTNDKPWALLTDQQRSELLGASDHFVTLDRLGRWRPIGGPPRGVMTATYRPVRILFGAP